MKRSDEAGKPKRDTPNSENKELERNNKSVRITRSEEKQDMFLGRQTIAQENQEPKREQTAS